MDVVLFKDAASETFESMQKLLWKTVHDFQKVKGNPYNKEEAEEMFSIACLSFVTSYKTYNPDSGALSTWVRFCVWHDLLSHCEKEHKAKQLRVDDYEKAQIEATSNHFADFLDELNDEARKSAM